MPNRLNPIVLSEACYASKFFRQLVTLSVLGLGAYMAIELAWHVSFPWLSDFFLGLFLICCVGATVIALYWADRVLDALKANVGALEMLAVGVKKVYKITSRFGKLIFFADCIAGTYVAFSSDMLQIGTLVFWIGCAFSVGVTASILEWATHPKRNGSSIVDLRMTTHVSRY